MWYLVEILADEVVAFDAIVVLGLKGDINSSFTEIMCHLQFDNWYAGCFNVLDFFDFCCLNYSPLTLKT